MRIGNEVPRRAYGDGRRLKQVLANLVSNAVKFTPAGTVAVTVGAAPSDAGSTRVHVEVGDTGIGIAAPVSPATWSRRWSCSSPSARTSS